MLRLYCIDTRGVGDESKANLACDEKRPSKIPVTTVWIVWTGLSRVCWIMVLDAWIGLSSCMDHVSG